MKILNKLIFILSFTLFFSSCESYLDVNTNPNNPTSVSPNLLLPAIEGRLSYIIGGDASRYSGIFDQHVDGVSRQFEVIQNYTFNPGDVNNMWGSLYSGVLTDISVLKKASEENGYTHYLAIGQILEAYTMLFITDTFGDVPYSEFNSGVLAPAYDSQASIYQAILSNLSNANTLLSSDDDSGFAPGNEDLIYKGDTEKWIKFGKAIEARAQLRTKNWPGALSAIQASYSSASDEAKFTYGSGSTENAPWYQYIDQRDDIEVGDSYVALLNSLSDPRVSTLGAPLAIPHPIFIKNQTLPFISYEEAKFIEAEATFRTSGATAAKTAYLKGIEASFNRTGQSSAYAAYIAQPSVSNVSLNTIMTQKYIALYTDQETFTDWRRTGIPSLTPNSGSEVPRRYPYPQSELDYNPNTPTGVTIFDRVPWDN